jgi:CelD/BcsL family acetyltransferase involved in cellulose biosynthesis
MECAATRTIRFVHLPSPAFLCLVPQNSVRRSSSGRFVELQSGPFCDIFHALLSEDQAVLAAVRSLLRPSRRNRVAADVEEVED